MASLQRHIIERQCALNVLFRRHCQVRAASCANDCFGENVNPGNAGETHRVLTIMLPDEY